MGYWVQLGLCRCLPASALSPPYPEKCTRHLLQEEGAGIPGAAGPYVSVFQNPDCRARFCVFQGVLEPMGTAAWRGLLSLALTAKRSLPHLLPSLPVPWPPVLILHVLTVISGFGEIPEQIRNKHDVPSTPRNVGASSSS